ncbi:MAG: hypothetical protein A2570_00135 [Candidatus Brennerbacteria bacterium RIFOXYD1_FULL_41_16]|uniref:Uncharacterized protein n=1 Tax=Candidatus Brennerbacteria bacterium RIFOXYD1_FULL_41_16 TaxID=1797529 RepID=A0A1G1XJW1_9BACT|nr:MAG: hypothetical protein A2570_00135 [Candidatus Brennerbacteria bacterium RIFOXYD1_FULL_41_16]
MKIKDLSKIEQLIELNARLSQEIGRTLPAIVKSLGKTKFKHTGKALLSFIPKTGYLNSAILELSASKNLYSAAILSRSIVEHNFRQQYIYVRALNDDSDDVGKRYYQTLKASEDLELFTKINNYNEVIDPGKTKWNTKGEHNKAIQEVGKEFGIKQIFFYLIKNNNNEKSETIEHFKKEYLLERLIEYTNLSSGVHGGPFGELVLYNLQKDRNEFYKALDKFAKDSFVLYYNTVELTYFFSFLMDNENKNHYEKIKALHANFQ